MLEDHSKYRVSNRSRPLASRRYGLSRRKGGILPLVSNRSRPLASRRLRGIWGDYTALDVSNRSRPLASRRSNGASAEG